mgnify:CR=1 FL=1
MCWMSLLLGFISVNNDRLISSLKKMRDLGNTLIVVEHDEDTMREADWLIDVGPGAGAFGGQIMASGTPEEVAKNKKSITGQYLSGAKSIPVPTERRVGNGVLSRLQELAKITLRMCLSSFHLES